jgi:hypothetical protein
VLDVISGCVAAGTASIAGLLLLLQVSSLNRVALIARWTPSPIQGWDRKVACVGEPVQRTVRNVAGHLPAIGRSSHTLGGVVGLEVRPAVLARSQQIEW